MYTLEFKTGRFDDYCVYVTKPNKRLWFPYDWQYLRWIQNLKKKYSVFKVYLDFLRIYNLARYDYDETEAYDVICEVDKTYTGDTEHWWSIFYMTMVAEERKENTILGKRIKRLGVYNVLFDNFTPQYTAEYMRGMRWYELEELMIERGI